MAYVAALTSGVMKRTSFKPVILLVLCLAVFASAGPNDCPLSDFTCANGATPVCGNTPTPSSTSPCGSGATYCRYDGSLPSSGFSCAGTPISISQSGTGPILVTLTATSGTFAGFVGVHGGNAYCTVTAPGTGSSITVSTPSQRNNNGNVNAKGFSNVGFCYIPCTCQSVHFTDEAPTDSTELCPGVTTCPTRTAVDNCGTAVTPTCTFNPISGCGTASRTWTISCPDGTPSSVSQDITVRDSDAAFSFTGVVGCSSPSGCPSASSDCVPEADNTSEAA